MEFHRGCAVQLAGATAAAPDACHVRVPPGGSDAETGRDDAPQADRRGHGRHGQVDEPPGRDRRRPPGPSPDGGPRDDPVAAGTDAADAAAAGLPPSNRTHGPAQRPCRARGLQPGALRADEHETAARVLRLPARGGAAHSTHPRRRDLERSELSDVLAQDGGATAYAALLARCYDVLHNRPGPINVISSTASRHDPAAFVFSLGDAYRVSGRTRQLFDTFGHNPYPENSAEPPSALHQGSDLIAEGDYETLDERAGHLVRRHEPASAGHAGRQHLVRGGRFPDGATSGEEALLPRPRERPARQFPR